MVPNREDVTRDIRGHRIVLMPDGSEVELTSLTHSRGLTAWPALAKLCHQVSGEDSEREAPKSTRLMQELQWAAREEASDRGHYRFYPKGALVLNLIEDWHGRILSENFGAQEVRTPILYNWAETDIRGEAGSFSERLYYVRGWQQRKEFVLRFGGDFGIFRMLRDLRIRHGQLPARFFERSTSFRYERSGELRGLHRARAFTFFDAHSLCGTSAEGLDEYGALHTQLEAIAEEHLGDFAVEFTASEEFFRSNKGRLLALLGAKRPAMWQLLSDRKHYWAIKHTFYTEDGYRFFNLQLDGENAERYGIHYIAANGVRTPCVICHMSLGSIERWMFLALEQAAKVDAGRLPVWLAPTQIRLIAIADHHVDELVELARRLAARRIRVDVDDRSMPVATRLHEALREKIPYTVVYGDRERASGLWPVRGGGGEEVQMEPEALITEVDRISSSMPFRPLGEVRVSRQVRFDS